MMVLITSSTAKRARNQAATPAQAAPASAPASNAAKGESTPADGNSRAVAAAADAPTMNWPSTPMLKTPAEKAHATASPVRMRGIALTSVADKIAYREPKAPRTIASAATSAFAPETTKNNMSAPSNTATLAITIAD